MKPCPKASVYKEFRKKSSSFVNVKNAIQKDPDLYAVNHVDWIEKTGSATYHGAILGLQGSEFEFRIFVKIFDSLTEKLEKLTTQVQKESKMNDEVYFVNIEKYLDSEEISEICSQIEILSLTRPDLTDREAHEEKLGLLDSIKSLHIWNRNN